MGITIVFKGGSMNGIGINYQEGRGPKYGEEITIGKPSRGFHFRDTGQVYEFIGDLNSWVYNHECELAREE